MQKPVKFSCGWFLSSPTVNFSIREAKLHTGCTPRTFSTATTMQLLETIEELCSGMLAYKTHKTSQRTDRALQLFGPPNQEVLKLCAKSLQKVSESK